MLAAEEINADGGILGKQIEFIEEDGQSEPTIFAEKINKLLTEDEVAAVFGGWTSASRKAMLPVVEGANGLLFYPVQYEGLEASKNIYYTGATTNQQIIPAMDFLKSEGREDAVPRRVRLRVPPHREQDHQAVRRGARHRDRR